MSSSRTNAPAVVTGGRFDFDDGGTYCGGWEDGKAHGHGVCTGPKGQGEYSGSWHFGFEVSGVYTWPSGSAYEGQWQNGKRHGMGVETRGRWLYRGEWTQGFKGRYGVRQSVSSGSKYEGTWANGLQDGYGSETYADSGTFQGQWMRGMRHGYGVRTSATFGLASHYRPKNTRESLSSLPAEQADPASERDRKMDDFRGGFVLKSRSDEPPTRRRSLVEKSSSFKKSLLQGLRIKKQRSTGDIDRRGVGSMRSSGSNLSSASSESSQSGMTQSSMHTDSNISFVSQDDVMDSAVTETYMGEWKNDKRCGFGIAERSDGLRYEGEWYNNKKYGYGVTTLKDGHKEEGKYKNNVLVSSGKKKHLFMLRSAKFRDRVDSAVSAAVRASQIALQKADIAISRTATARGKAEQADVAAMHAREDSDVARLVAKQFAPELQVPGPELLKQKFVNRLQAETPPQGKNLFLSPNKTTIATSKENVPNTTLKPELQPQPPILGNATSKTFGGSIQRLNQPAAEPPAKTPNYLGPSNPSVQDQLRPDVAPSPPSRQGSFRQQRNPSIREGFTLAMSDHMDQYRQDVKPRFVIRKGRRIPSPPRGSSREVSPLPFQSAGSGYSPDATPDSGVSESMDRNDVSPTHFSRRLTLPPVIYADTLRKPGLLSFAPPSDSEDSAPVGNPHRAESGGGGERADSAAQDVAADVGGPHRTSSLYVNPPSRRKPQVQQPVIVEAPVPKRKKSLPNIQALATKSKVMPREEVSMLSSQRREEVRRQHEEAEKLRSNPLLYLVNPDVKDWFSRQQLIMLVLFINISLAIMFFKLLT